MAFFYFLLSFAFFCMHRFLPAARTRVFLLSYLNRPLGDLLEEKSQYRDVDSELLEYTHVPVQYVRIV